MKVIEMVNWMGGQGRYCEASKHDWDDVALVNRSFLMAAVLLRMKASAWARPRSHHGRSWHEFDTTPNENACLAVFDSKSDGEKFLIKLNSTDNI